MPTLFRVSVGPIPCNWLVPVAQIVGRETTYRQHQQLGSLDRASTHDDFFVRRGVERLTTSIVIVHHPGRSKVPDTLFQDQLLYR